MHGNLAKASRKHAFSTKGDVCCGDRPLCSAETDAASRGVAIGATILVRRMHADWSHSNYLAKATFTIEITIVWAHRNAWMLAETFGRDQINRKVELTGVKLL